MAEITGRPQIEVLRGEAGIILKSCASLTKVATQDKADKKSRRALGKRYSLTQAPKIGDVSVNLGLKAGRIPGTVWRKVGAGENRKYLAIGKMSKKFDSVRWLPLRKTSGGTWGKYTSSIRPVMDVVDNMPRYIARGRKAIGLARQSWVQIGDALGIDLAAVQGGRAISRQGIAKARAALASDGRAYTNGSGSQLLTQERAQITLINNLPYGIAIGLDKTLLRVIGGRAKYFEQSYAHGAFDTVRKIARAYPWMRLSLPA
jgi:hypothetical protein